MRPRNDTARINRVLKPMLQAAMKAKKKAAAERFLAQIVQRLNTILERQQTLNKCLEQMVMVVEEQSQNVQETRRLLSVHSGHFRGGCLGGGGG